ncbi:hypothetical protein P4O66_007232, partial [Electrophorus voltai]
MSQDLWLQNYDATCRLAQEIAENIHERNRQQRTGGNPAKLNMTLRASLQKMKQNVSMLRETLIRASSQRRMYPSTERRYTQSEADRRQSLLDDLVTKEKQLCASFNRNGTDLDPSRSTLMTGGPGRGAGPGVAANPWLLNEPEETRGLTFGEIKEQQQRIIQGKMGRETPPTVLHPLLHPQDAGLDALAAVIGQQKRMGQEIGNELDEQNEVIDDITQLVDKTDGRIRNETQRVKLVETKSASCGQKHHGIQLKSKLDPNAALMLPFVCGVEADRLRSQILGYMILLHTAPGDVLWCPPQAGGGRPASPDRRARTHGSGGGMRPVWDTLTLKGKARLRDGHGRWGTYPQALQITLWTLTGFCDELRTEVLPR